MTQPAFVTLFAPEQRSATRGRLGFRLEMRAWMMPDVLNPDMSVDEIMRRWPATIGVMIRHRMLCIGCPIGIFHTVADAAAAHAKDEVAFSAELLAAMRADPSTEARSASEANATEPEASEGKATCA